jgi:hypothetical protein
MKWKDISSYAHGVTVCQPTCWELEDPQKLLRVVVVYGHIHAPGCWCFHCSQLGFDTVELLKVPQSPEAGEQAKLEALRCVLDRLRDMSSAAAEMARATWWPLSNGGEPSNAGKPARVELEPWTPAQQKALEDVVKTLEAVVPEIPFSRLLAHLTARLTKRKST